MKTKLIILGSGNSMGVPQIDGSWEIVIKKIKKISEQDVRQLF